MDYFYCCPFCGQILESLFDEDYFCINCIIDIKNPVKSKYETQHYIDVAREKFSPNVIENGNSGQFRWREILIEEVSQNPLFDVEKYKKRMESESEFRCISKMLNYQNDNQNKPKCPTCQSTNISKISATSKVAGAAMFGLFSKTARSQFKCNNCGYKW